MGCLLGAALRRGPGSGRQFGRPLRSAIGLHVGTSGWSYPSWKPGFYPADARPEGFLRHYAKRFATVELNTTGYRLPSEEQFRRWADATPPGFTFAVKMPPRVLGVRFLAGRPQGSSLAASRRTPGQSPDVLHAASQASALHELATFEERVRRLGDRLGPVRAVVQQARAEGFLASALGSIDPGLRYAFDFRHPSWDDPEIDPRLAEAGAVRVGALETEAGFRYLRFRDPPYSNEEIGALADTIRPLLARGVEVFAYFRHEDQPTAPGYAQLLNELV